MTKRQRSKAQLKESLDGQARRQSGAIRTAWIIGGIALAFYVVSLVQGHRGELYTTWHKTPTVAVSSQGTVTQTATSVPAQRGGSVQVAGAGSSIHRQP